MATDATDTRPPDWRYRRAAERAEGAARRRGHDDPDVRCAATYLRNLSRCADEDSRRNLALRMPDVHEAYRIHASADRGPRLRIEMRILAGEAAETIAERSGLAPETVRIYERLFYDVRGRLARPDYIGEHALGGSGQPREAAYRAIAYRGGPHVVDELLGVPDGLRPSDPDRAPSYVSEGIRRALRARLLSAVSGPGPQGGSVQRDPLLGLAARLEAAAGDGPGASGELQRAVDGLFEETARHFKEAFQVGKYCEVDPKWKDLFEGGAEATTGQLMARLLDLPVPTFGGPGGLTWPAPASGETEGPAGSGESEPGSAPQ